MKLALLGGGGFRVPLVFGALLDDPSRLITELSLYDTSAARLSVITTVLSQLDPEGAGPVIHATTDLAEAVSGADFVFSAVRVGGLSGRVTDERAALSLGVLGQETTGPGGIAYALRTAPVALEIARTVKEHAPNAFVINFTNPAGIITELMQSVLGSRMIGICDTPSGLGKRLGALYGADETQLSLDYVGLNHLGWLRHAWYQGLDLVSEILADDDALARLEEGKVFGADWLRAIRMLPNEYLYYYYFNREAVRSITSGDATRGEFLLAQQARFYRDAEQNPDAALALWQQTRDQREASYMAESREKDEERPDVAGGGYERVALSLMSAIVGGGHRPMILNVRNGSTLPSLPADAVVEVPCLVDTAGAHPLATAEPPAAELSLMIRMKEIERLTIRSVLEQDPELAYRAIALHPLVDSVAVARELFESYRANA